MNSIYAGMNHVKRTFNYIAYNIILESVVKMPTRDEIDDESSDESITESQYNEAIGEDGEQDWEGFNWYLRNRKKVKKMYNQELRED